MLIIFILHIYVLYHIIRHIHLIKVVSAEKHTTLDLIFNVKSFITNVYNVDIISLSVQTFILSIVNQA